MKLFSITISTKFILICLALSDFTSGIVYAQVSVKKWADDKKSAFSFTFDDCCMSQYTYAAPVLNSFGFKGTFFVISGTGFLTDDLPGIQRFGTWKQFRSMSLDGHEIGSHSVTHPNLTTLLTGDTSTSGTLLYELYQSQKTINQKISYQKCVTIAYPQLAYNTNVINRAAVYYESARCGSDFPVDSSLIGLSFYSIGAKEELFNTPRTSTLNDQDELQNFETYVQSSINLGKWGLLEAHEVVPFSQIPLLVSQGEYYPMSSEWLTSLCQWLKQKSDSNYIWVETFGNVTRYMKEREQFHYNITLNTSTQMNINLTDSLNNLIYCYPLTVDVTVPADWKAAIVTQGSKKDTIKTFIAGNGNYIRAHAVPDGGTLTLIKTDPPLPVELTSFTAKIINKAVHLNWYTSTEISNYRFDIERMFKSNYWQKIGSLPGAGNSNSPKVYSFTDNSPLLTGNYFYRLKQIDNDGHYKYSNNVEVTLTPVSNSLHQNYPNPFNPSTKIQYELSSNQFVTLKVYDVLGNVLETLVNEDKPSGNHELIWNSANLSGGVYFYRIKAGNFIDTKKMLLLK
jgi:hypothetical protein